MVGPPPERSRGGPGWRRRRVRLHGGEQLPDEALRRPAQDADRAARPADADELVGGLLVVRGEHHADGGDDHVEVAVAVRERLGIGGLPGQPLS